ncbi:hypothetical protein Tco_0622392 [Tanacetum coccineum]
MESQSETSQTVSALKHPVLKTEEYDLWSMRMEQYLTFTDHDLWEVIVNGDSVTPVASASAGAEGIKEDAEDHFHKQNYENFAASSQEGLDKTYDRFQNLISQLEIHGEVISQEDANLKFTNETVNTAHNDSAASSKDQASTTSYADDVMFSFLFPPSNAHSLGQ